MTGGDWTRDDIRRLRQLRTPLGISGSARVRYAAAMHFHETGRIGDDTLEAYRICAARDWDDPAEVLAERGVRDPLPETAPTGAATAIADLIDEADRYLSDLRGPGVAEARAGIAAWRSDAIAPGDGRNTVADRWLEAALAPLEETHAALALALRMASPHLPWRSYVYAMPEIGETFPRDHAYCSLIGPEHSCVRAEDFDFGVFLIGPGTLYRDHAHPAPELYAPLTGPHGWRFGPETPIIVKPAHEPIWNEPHGPHMTKVGPVPFLGFYAWTRDIEAPAYVLPAGDWEDLERLDIGTLA